MDNIVTLTNSFGIEEQFELLDIIEYNEVEYVVLLPVSSEDGEVTILQYENSDGNTESYVSVEDEELLMTVYRLFKEKWKSEYDFADDEDLFSHGF